MTVPTTNKSPLRDKKGKKSRSKSIGPGGMDALKDMADAANRRKSAFVPQSILPSKEDEQKRREARRKSLANRRVSFAPEATLHTWDVIEYLRDATPSTASSGSARHASVVAKARSSESPAKKSRSQDTDASEPIPPSTPPEQAEDTPIVSASPADQRGLHQKKRRRRSSGIPPMNFNNPDDVYSSSPTSGESAITSSPFNVEGDEDGSNDDAESTAMSLVTDEGEPTVTSRTSGTSEGSNDSTGSSARLDAALRQAAEAAGTRGLEIDDGGEASMEIADGTVTDAFQPWMDACQKTTRAGGSPVKQSAKVASLLDSDKENVNPFSPAFKAGTTATIGSPQQEIDDQDNGVSMDITQAVGRIMPQKKQMRARKSLQDDATMDLTVAVGRIQPNAVDHEADPTTIPKRRRTLSSGSPLKLSKESHGSPATRRIGRDSAVRRRRSSGITSNLDEVSMEFTTAVGGIQQNPAKASGNRRASVERLQSSTESSVSDDEAMDLTLAVGQIQENGARVTTDDDPSLNSNEELSMELTTVMGGIQGAQKSEQEDQPKTPITEATSDPLSIASTPKDQNRFKDVQEPTPKKLTPLLEKQARTLETRTPPKTPRKSPRKSIGRPSLCSAEQVEEAPAIDGEPVVPDTPEVEVADISENEKENEPPSPSPKKKPAFNSPTKAFATPEKELAAKETRTLSESMRLLSTPRKEVSQSPLKRLTSATPKKQATPKSHSPIQKSLTPLKRASPAKSASSRKKVQVEQSLGSPIKQDKNRGDSDAVMEEIREPIQPSPEHIHLQHFLDMTSIRFMDLTTTRRRHTAVPSSIKTPDLNLESGSTLSSRVAAGACLVPTLEMFQHSCRELKHYIASGHEVVDQIAAEAAENQPALFREYSGASRAQRAIMDKQFGNVKTNARLLSKGMWYEWRSQLLKGLKVGFEGIAEGMERDGKILEEKERMIAGVLPELQARRESLETEKQVLEQQVRDVNESDREELDEVREGLVDVGKEIEEKKRMLEQLQKYVREKNDAIETSQEKKAEMIAEIKEAERIREESCGWSAVEVRGLQESVQALEAEHGWSIISASNTNVTMVYRNSIQLFFDMASFRLGGSAYATKQENSSIRLTYIGDDNEHRPRPLTTETRFFLQIMRAHLQCISQGQTRVKELLDFVSSGWQMAWAVSAAVKGLERGFITEPSILSDEKMEIRSMMLLSKLETKIMIGFEVGAAVQDGKVNPHITPTARVAYGESYNERKMAEFLASKVGDRFDGWADAVWELKEKLLAKGRKTTRT
ncbi:Spc7-domain-containing protein [Viridothelium virens]|uniref:Spc7-domain-containing protein n=1 Tax=Viridothelium virens TaxID=1048519 RepID=A0A6A6H003_VIRVR|nr:Spc7-domain-containing protein [Viridothelium virens]